MKTSRSLIVLLAGGLLASLAVTACGGDDEPEEREYTTVKGSVSLQAESGTETSAGVTVEIGDEYETTTNSSGEFEKIDIAADDYEVTASFTDYVSSTKSISVEDRETTEVHFKLNQQRAPQIESLSVTPKTVEPGGTAEASVTASDANEGAELSYRFATTNGFTVEQDSDDPTLADITAPDEEEVEGSVRVTVTDETDRKTTREVSITTGTTNDGPSIQSITPQGPTSGLAPGDDVTLEATATDPDGDDLDYSWETPDGWDAVPADDNITTITTIDEYDERGTMNLTVTDEADNTDTAKIVLRTKSADAPRIVSVSADRSQLDPNEGLQTVIRADAEDDDTPANELSFDWQVDNADWTIGEETSAQTGVTAPDQYGLTATFSVDVSDPAGNSASGKVIVSTVSNQGPRLDGQGVIVDYPENGASAVKRGGKVSVRADNPTDPNGDELDFNWNVASSDWTINGSGSAVSITAPQEPGTSTTVTLEVLEANVTNPKKATASAIVRTKPNSAPTGADLDVVESDDDHPEVVGISSTFTAQASNVTGNDDRDPLTFTWTSLNSNYTIAGSNTGQTIHVDAPEAPKSYGALELEISDGFDSETLTINVRTMGNTDPSIDETQTSPAQNDSNSRYKLDRSGSSQISTASSDDDGHSLNYQWRVNNSDWSVSGTDGDATVNAPNTASSTVKVTLRVSDGYGGTDSAAWYYNTRSNKRPNCDAKSPSIDTVSFREGETKTMSVSCSDLDGDTPLVYDWMNSNSSAGWSISGSGDSITLTAPSDGSAGDASIAVGVEDALGKCSTLDDNDNCTTAAGWTAEVSANDDPKIREKDSFSTGMTFFPGRTDRKTWDGWTATDKENDALSGSKISGALTFNFTYSSSNEEADMNASWAPRNRNKHGRKATNDDFAFEVTDGRGGSAPPQSYTYGGSADFNISSKYKFRADTNIDPISSVFGTAPAETAGWGDINGDGAQDIVAYDQDGGVLAIGFAEPSNNTFSLGPKRTSWKSNAPSNCARPMVAQVDGSGGPDVVLTCTERIHVVTTDGNQSITGLEQSGIDASISNITDVEMADVTGDGTGDIIFSDDGSENHYVVTGEGSGKFASYVRSHDGPFMDAFDATDGGTPVASFDNGSDQAVLTTGQFNNDEKKERRRVNVAQALSCNSSLCTDTVEVSWNDGSDSDSVKASIYTHANLAVTVPDCNNGDNYEVDVVLDGSDGPDSNTYTVSPSDSGSVDCANGDDNTDIASALQTDINNNSDIDNSGSLVSADRPNSDDTVVVQLDDQTDDGRNFYTDNASNVGTSTTTFSRDKDDRASVLQTETSSRVSGSDFDFSGKVDVGSVPSNKSHFDLTNSGDSFSTSETFGVSITSGSDISASLQNETFFAQVDFSDRSNDMVLKNHPNEVTTEMELHDVNGSGCGDAVIGRYDVASSVDSHGLTIATQGSCNGSFGSAMHLSFANVNGAMDVGGDNVFAVSTDIDSDGSADLFHPMAGRLVFGNGQGGFDGTMKVSGSYASGSNPVVADWNNSGAMDLFLWDGEMVDVLY